jgi:hypothetical protein
MVEFEKDPGETLDYAADFAGHCARIREPNTDYSTNTIVLPVRATGLQYKCTTAGRTGTNEPRWPMTAAQTVTDGSVVWTAEAITTGSLLRTLSSAAWSADTGVTVGSPSTAGTKSTVLISGGTEGQDYDVICTGTCSDGTYPVVSFTLKVRRPARTVSCEN